MPVPTNRYELSSLELLEIDDPFLTTSEKIKVSNTPESEKKEMEEKKEAKGVFKEMGKSAITGKDIGSTMGGSIASKLYPKMLKQKKKMDGTAPPNLGGNRIMVKPGKDQLCVIDTKDLMKSLNGKSGPTIEELMALLQQLLCAGIENALALIIEGIDLASETVTELSAEALKYMGVSEDADILFDVAGAGVSGRMPSVMHNGAEVSMNGLGSIDTSKTNGKDKKFDVVDQHLNEVDPAWDDDDDEFSIISRVRPKSRKVYVEMADAKIKTETVDMANYNGGQTITSPQTVKKRIATDTAVSDVRVYMNEQRNSILNVA